MPKIVRADIDNLNVELTVTLQKSDYEDRFNSELTKYRKQAHMKGFRKGKTPMSVLRKMYGRAVLMDIVNDLLQKEVFNYLNEEKIEFLGQPLPAEDQPDIDFDAVNPGDFEFKFSLGLRPGFEVQGLDDNTAFECYEVQVDEKSIDQEIENARKRLGENITVTDDIREGDIIRFAVAELDGENLKENGVSREFQVPVDRMTESFRQEVLQHKAGDVLRVNVFGMEEGSTPENVRRYLLDLEDEEQEVGPFFQATIAEVNRNEPAALDEDFFGKLFEGETEEISTLEAARDKIREDLSKFFRQQAESLLYRDFQDHLMAHNELPLPDDFLKRWLKSSNEKTTDAVIAREYDDFAKNLQWTLIRSKLAKNYEVQVSEEEIRAHFKDQIRRMINNPMLLQDDFLDNMALRMMEREEDYDRAAQEILAEKIFESIRDRVAITPKPIGEEAFMEVVRKVREEDAAKARARSAAQEEE